METKNVIRRRGGKDEKHVDDDKVTLKPKIGLLSGINVIVGSIIGSGIFISPTGVLRNTNSINSAMIVWFLSGVFSMVGAYCYCELGLMIKKSGADYAYIFTTFGPFFGFLRLWIEVIVIRPCTQTVIALTFSIYTQRNFFPNCDPPDSSQRMLAACCILLLTGINCWDVKWATRVQDVFTFAKLIALLIVIATGIWQLAMGNVEYFTFDDTNLRLDAIGLAFYSGLFAYNGWSYLNFIIEELINPERNLPYAAAIALFIVTIIYMLINASFYSVLSAKEVLASEAVAITYADRIFGEWGWCIPIFVAISTFGAVNGVLLTSSRLYYAGAIEHQMPEVLTLLHITRFCPVPAVIITALLSLCYLAINDVYSLINIFGFANWLGIGCSVLCIIVLRFTQPELERPIKINLFWPVLYLIGTLFVTISPMYAAPFDTLVGVLAILSSVPVYFIFIYWKNKPMCCQNCMGGLTKFVQKLTVTVRPDTLVE